MDTKHNWFPKIALLILAVLVAAGIYFLAIARDQGSTPDTVAIARRASVPNGWHVLTADTFTAAFPMEPTSKTAPITTADTTVAIISAYQSTDALGTTYELAAIEFTSPAIAQAENTALYSTLRNLRTGRANYLVTHPTKATYSFTDPNGNRGVGAYLRHDTTVYDFAISCATCEATKTLQAFIKTFQLN